jgi:hypothetical protein
VCLKSKHYIIIIIIIIGSTYVGLGLPQKLLPAKVSGYCFVTFRDKNLFQGGVISPRPTPGYPGMPMFSVRLVSLS